MTTPRTAPLVGLLLVACKVANPTYCPPGGRSCELDGDAGIQGCASNAECTSSNAPVCDVTGDRTCVQCLGTGEQAVCGGATPICEHRACRVCKSHAECGSDACSPSGACIAEADVAYVDDAGQDNLMCSRAQPCKTVTEALKRNRSFLKLHGALNEGVTIDNRNLRILSDPEAKLTRSASGPILDIRGTSSVEINDLLLDRPAGMNDPVLVTGGTAAVTLRQVTVSNSRANGINCGGASLTLSQSTVAKNAGIGVACTAGTLTIADSFVRTNAGGGINVNAGAGTTIVTNTVIAHNGTLGGSGSVVGGASLTLTGAGSRFEFNTVADNHVRDLGATFAGGLNCAGDLVSANNIIAHNDLDGNVDKINSNTTCVQLSSAVTASLADLKFVNSTNDPYDYHLMSGSVAIDAATTPSTIAADAYGTARPQGAQKDQGAVEYKP